MRKFRTVCAFIGLVVVISGCKVDSKYEVFVQDLVEIADTGETLFAPGSLEIEMASCESNFQDVYEVIEKYYLVTGDPNCIDRNLDEYLQVKIKSPIVNDGNSLPQNVPTGLSVKFDESAGSFEIFAILNYVRFNSLEADVKRLDATVELELNLVQIVLNNDLRSTVDVTTPSGYLNGKPMVYGEATLDRRENLTIQFSEIFPQNLREQGKIKAATLTIN